ncbi:MFS transporter [Patescibacteria group bacterium]
MNPSTVFVLYRALMGLAIGFMATAYAPYCVSIGITLPEIALINAAFFAAIVLSELPTGLLADGRGRLWSMRVGVLVASVGFALYGLVIWEFWGALICEVLVGIGFAFMSGAEQAWLADELAARNQPDRLQASFAGGAMWFAVASIVSGLIGAQVSAWNLQAGMICTAAVCVVKVLYTFLVMRETVGADAAATELSALRQSFGVLRAGRGLAWAMVAGGSYGLVLSFNHYWTLFFRAGVGQSGLGYVWALMLVSVAAGGWLVQRCPVREGREHLPIVGTMLLIGGGMAVCGLVPGMPLALGCLALHEVGRGAFQPLLDTYVQRRVESPYRATYGSLQSLVSRLCFVAIASAVWAITSGMPVDGRFIPVVWGVQGAVLVAVSLLLALFRSRRS